MSNFVSKTFILLNLIFSSALYSADAPYSDW